MSDQVFGREYADQYDLLYGDKDYEAECDLLGELFRRYGDGNIHAILDLGCGTGSHAIPLAQRGYQVTGVDRSPGMLAQAQRKATEVAQSSTPVLSEAEGFSVPTFLHGDVRSVDLGQTFDAVLMMFSVLSYQLTNDDVAAGLRAVWHHLRPGGLFLFDVWYGPAVLAIRPGDRVKVIPTPDGQLIRAASSRLDVRHHLCEVSCQLWRLSGDRLVSTSHERHRVRYFFPMELEQWLAQMDMRLEALRAFPQIQREADESSWNVLGVGRALVRRQV